MRISEKQNPSEVAVRLREHMAKMSRSQTAVAKAIGLSGAVISAYLAGTYAGDIPATETKILQYLDLQAQRAERIDAHGEIIQTKALVHITAALDAAACDLDMVVITGPAGAGKTTSLKLYAKEHAAAILIEADNGYTSMALFAELCDKLGLQSKGTLHDLFRRVIEKLSDSGRLFIIDEAEQLKHNTLDLVRRVHDKAGIPIALVGQDRLKVNLKGDRNHYTYLWSRVGLCRKVDLLSAKEEEAIILSRLGDVPEGLAAVIHKQVRGNARVLVKLIRWCLKLCKIRNCALDEAIILDAAELVSVA